jgi:hypothetical protein
MDLQHMIFRTCTVLLLRENERTRSASTLRRLVKFAKFQSGNFKYVCRVLYVLLLSTLATRRKMRMTYSLPKIEELRNVFKDFV